MYQSFLAELQGELATATREHDLIYSGELVPDVLPVAEGKVMVKAEPFVNDEQASDPFVKVVPFAVQEASSAYAEKRRWKVQPALDAVGEQNDILKGTLASMNLPGAIEALETPEGMPPSLLDKMSTVKEAGGAVAIIDRFEELDKASSEAKAMLSEAKRVLDDEEQEDNDARTDFGAQWQRTPSHTLTMRLRQEEAKFSGHLEHATKSDNMLRQKWDEWQAHIFNLSGAQSDLEALLPRNDAAHADQSALAELKQLLSELDALVTERESLRENLQVK